MNFRKVLEIGGLASGAILVAFGIAAIIMGFGGRSTVDNSLKQEYIVGTPDMTPSAIAAEAKQAKLPASISLPTCNVANQAVDNGSRARCFAQYMRIHALEATGGYTYSQIGRFQALPSAPKSELAKGGGTDNQKYAAIDPKTKQPVSNGVRDVWVTETALATALNTSYMAQQLSIFGIVVGFALLLAGIGFVILALGGALRRIKLEAPATSAAAPKTQPVAS
jgi:hypothetical protein